MISKFDPLLGRLREEDTRTVNNGGTTVTQVIQGGGGGGGTAGIPQYDSDPGSPAAEDAWVLRTPGTPGSPAGEPIGILMALTSTGSASGPDTFQFSYQTHQGSTKRVTLG